MKKIFLLFAAACALVACNPTEEDISNGSHISLDELKAMSTVAVDKADNGQNGNVITCSTTAPVNAKWTIDGKDFTSNYARKKMKVGDYVVTLTAVCPDGTELTYDTNVSCEVITEELQKFMIYDGEPFTIVASGDAGQTRFSDTEGKHWPTISDEVYDGLKTLVFEIKDAQDGPGIWGMPDGSPLLRVMNGWWSTTYADGVEVKPGLLEITITEAMARECAKKYASADPAGGKDLTLLVTRGTITFGDVYYEE